MTDHDVDDFLQLVAAPAEEDGRLDSRRQRFTIATRLSQREPVPLDAAPFPKERDPDLVGAGAQQCGVHGHAQLLARIRDVVRLALVQVLRRGRLDTEPAALAVDRDLRLTRRQAEEVVIECEQGGGIGHAVERERNLVDRRIGFARILPLPPIHVRRAFARLVGQGPDRSPSKLVAGIVGLADAPERVRIFRHRPYGRRRDAAIDHGRERGKDQDESGAQPSAPGHRTHITTSGTRDDIRSDGLGNCVTCVRPCYPRSNWGMR